MSEEGFAAGDIVDAAAETKSGDSSGPVSSDTIVGKVFVSYSRRDIAFADALVAELESVPGLNVLIDRAGIAHGEDWRTRLGHLISESDTVVFIVSPDSVTSEICEWEVKETKRLSKRLIPVLWRPVDFSRVPTLLGDINAVPFHDEHGVTGFRKLVEALKSDLDWLRENTRVAERAAEWNTADRAPAFLIGSFALNAMRKWLERRPATAPQPTSLQREYIRACEQEETRVLSEAGRRAAELQAANIAAEEARQAAEAARESEAAASGRVVRATRLGLTAVVTLLIGVVIAAAFALRNLSVAETQTARLRDQLQRTEVTRARFLTNLSVQQLRDLEDPTLAYLLGVEAFTSHQSDGVEDAVPEAGTAYLTAALALRERRVIRHEAAAPTNQQTLIVDSKRARLATFSGSEILVWDIGRLGVIARLRGHSGSLLTAFFSQDGEMLLSEGEDGQRLWSTATGREVANIPRTGDPIRTLLVPNVRPGSELVELQSNAVAYFDWRTGSLTPLPGIEGSVSWALLTNDLKRVILCAGDRLLTIDSLTGQRLVDVEMKTSSGRWGIGPDGRHVAFAGGATDVEVVDTMTGARRRYRHAGRIYQVVFLERDGPDGGVMIAGSWDGTIVLRRLADGAQIGRLDAPATTNPEIAVSSDTRYLLFESDAQLGLWRLADLEKTPLALPSGFKTRTAAFAGPNDSLLLVAGATNDSPTTLVFDRTDGRLTQTMPGAQLRLDAARMSPDGTVLVPIWNGLALDEARGIELWPLDRARSLTKVGPAAIAPIDAYWREDGSLVTLTADRLVRIFAPQSTAGEWEVAGSPHRLRAISHGGTRLLVVDDDRRPTKGEVRDAGTGRLVASLRFPPVDDDTTPHFVAAFSPDGHRLVTGSHGNAAIVWNADTGARVAQLSGHKGALVWIVVSLDGRTVVTSAYNEDAAQSWRLDTGQPLHRFEHEDHVAAAVFHPVNPWLLTTSWDHSARLWNLETGHQLGAFRHFTEETEDRWVRGAVFSADGSRLLTAYDEHVVEWDVATFTERSRYSTASSRTRSLRPFYANGGRAVGATTIDFEITLWRAGTDTPNLTIRDRDSWFEQVTSEPLTSIMLRDRFLIAATPARIWDLRLNRLMLELSDDRGLFGAAGRIITNAADGALRSWRLGALLDAPDTLAPRCLTPAERSQFFLDPDPPAWCITGPGQVGQSDPRRWAPLWPYDTDQWRQWLSERRQEPTRAANRLGRGPGASSPDLTLRAVP